MKKKIHIFVKTIQLVYEASPSRMIIILIFSFVLGAILPIATYFWGLFIDGIPADIADYDIRQAILFLTINAILLLRIVQHERNLRITHPVPILCIIVCNTVLILSDGFKHKVIKAVLFEFHVSICTLK